MGDQKYGNRGDMMGYRGDRMEYRGDRMVIRGNMFRERNDQDRGLNTIKVTLPKFKESSDPNEFLEWKFQSEQIFHTNNISKTLKAKYALMQFDGNGSTWWEFKRRERESHHNYELPTWQDLIALMVLRYLTPNYYQEMLKNLYMLRKGITSVEEYYDKFENLRMKSKIEENMEYTVEVDMKEENSYKAKSSLTSTWSKGRDNWKTTSSREQPKGGGQAAQVKLDYKSKASEQPQGDIRLKMKDEREEKNEGEGDRGEGEKGPLRDEEERLDKRVSFACFMEKGKSLVDDDEDLNMNANLLCVVRRIMGAFAKEELDQRENTFHARCTIHDKVCSLIIDSGGCTKCGE
ncbi:hypothetical protein RDI58_022283 [Solanum bulbocastanum]|uniref:Retrotransposon gag domain-containing protein n=1 Tax=Solanum bulbocastanum TaxID=147425 RepID=A0AAN8Y5H9_SOLBU